MPQRMKRLFDYQIVCRQDDNGSFVAYVPAIEGCHAIGATPEEAQQELHHVFDMIADEYAQSGKPMPDDVLITVTHAR
jgi:predicted RNase H-like HicB family nuclease